MVKYKKQLQEELDAKSRNLDFKPSFENYNQMSFLKKQFTKLLKHPPPIESKNTGKQIILVKSNPTAPIGSMNTGKHIIIVKNTPPLNTPIQPRTMTFEVHLEDEAKKVKVHSSKEEVNVVKVKTEIKEEPLEVIDEAVNRNSHNISEDMDLIKQEPGLTISETQLSEENPGSPEETIFIEVIETAEEEDEEDAHILTEEGVPPVKKIKLLREGDPKPDEDFFQGLLPYFKQMTGVQKKRIQDSIENMILEEFEK